MISFVLSGQKTNLSKRAAEVGHLVSELICSLFALGGGKIF